MIKVVHFADAHIDMANYGRHNPQTGLPRRVEDFLKSLDTIVDYAVQEKADLVLFAGDAYKDRTPAPTYQREWGKRMMKLSRAGIPTLLLIGNHDVSPAAGRAYSIQEFDTLAVPHIRVISKPCFLKPEDLEGLQVQIIALPWITRSTVAAGILNTEESEGVDPFKHLQEVFSQMVELFLLEADPTLPIILMAHASVEGAKYGGERSVMLGADFTLPGSLVKDLRIDYTALGHIHKKQDLNAGNQPPVVYPGSIERVDFGEAADEKYYVVAYVEKKNTRVEFRQLTGIRTFIDRSITLQDSELVTELCIKALPVREKLNDAIVRLVINYPRELEPLIDEMALRDYAKDAFEFHLIRRPTLDNQVRLDTNLPLASLSPLELTGMYWSTIYTSEEDKAELQKLAGEVMSENLISPDEILDVGDIPA